MLLSRQMNKVAKTINAYLQAEGLTSAEFGRKTGLKKQQLSLLLNETTNPENMRAGNLYKAAGGMGISMEQLLRGEQPAVSADAQTANHIRALQIVARSIVRALNSNIQVVGQDVGKKLKIDARGPKGGKPFDTRFGLLNEVLSILGQADLDEEGGDAPPKQAGSAK